MVNQGSVEDARQLLDVADGVENAAFMLRLKNHHYFSGGAFLMKLRAGQ